MKQTTFQTLNDLMVVPGYERLLRANSLDSLDALFAVVNDDRLSKPGLAAWRERLRLTLSAERQQRVFYLKRFRHPPRSARREVRRSRSGASSVAGVEWTWMHRLARDGVPCVNPVALGEEFRNGRELRSAVLTAAVPGQSLEQWADQWISRDSRDDRRTARRLIEPTADIVARLHRSGYIHRDLYLSHIFFDPDAPLKQSLHLIDLQRVIQPAGRRRRWIVKELASLNFSLPGGLISNTDRLRWLTRYFGVRKLNASMRRLFYLIVGKTRWIARHQRRRASRLRSCES